MMSSNKKFDGIFGIFKSEKAGRIIFIVGIAGILLIFLSTYIKDKPKETKTDSVSSQSTEAYSEMLETKLSAIVSDITASPNVRVLVTLESGTEYVYANEINQDTNKTEDVTASDDRKVQQKDSTQQKYIIVQSPEGGEIALLVTELAPKVKGVVVVCDGGNNPAVAEKVSDAITTVLNIPSKRVCVTGRS